MASVSIITVSFNQPAVTEALLHSIESSDFIKEIIVVDNGSAINPVPGWQENFPHVHFIRSERNLGFAGGNNLGIAHATGEYLFFVNNDTEFTSALVRTLVQELDKDPSIGMISPQINYFSDQSLIQYAGYTPMNFYTCQNHCICGAAANEEAKTQKTRNTGYVHGAAMMVRTDAVLQAGLMDELFFLYYEEFDWCERIRKLGYRIAVCNRALIYHKESVSVGKNSRLKEYFMNRNRILFMRRNATPLQRRTFYIYYMTLVFPRNLFGYLLNGNYQFISALFKAVWWNIKSPSVTTTTNL